MMAGSLCTGIGGLDLAVEAHFGAELAWYAEVEPAPCKVLEREWPGVPNLGDLTTLDWAAVPPVDVLTAGYPCQPFSHAGRRKGTDDHRHLWPYIAAAVRVLRPRWVVLENVAGHLSLGFDAVLGDLAEAGLNAEWCVLRASDVGACHQRARLFIVAADASHVGHERGRGARRRGTRPADGGRPTADTNGAGLGKRDKHHSKPQPGLDQARGGHPDGLGQVAWGRYAAAVERWERTLGRPAPPPTDTRRRLSPPFVEWVMGYPEGWVDGLTRTQALKALGNAVVPQQAAAALRELAA